jgi:hypothetical protein
LDGAGLETPAPAGTAPGLLRYLTELRDACDRAAAGAGGYEDFYCQVAGLDVRLRFAGPALGPRLAPAFGHVRSEPVSSPALTIRIFDSDTTGAELPAAPWDASVFRNWGKVHVSIGGRPSGVFDAERFGIYDARLGEGLYWVRAAGEIHTAETGSPLVGILHLWLETHGVQIAHAGAVGSDEGCVLVIGHGGAGKSSTVLACLPSGLGLLGDDYCLIGPEDPPFAYTLFSSAKANADTIARLPFLAPMVSNPDRPPEDKALCLLAEHVPEKFVARAPIKAVAIPRVTARRETTVAPARAGAALAVLGPSTLSQLRGAGDGALARLARLVRAVPSHYIEVGTDPDGVAAAVRSLLDA